MTTTDLATLRADALVMESNLRAWGNQANRDKMRDRYCDAADLIRKLREALTNTGFKAGYARGKLDAADRCRIELGGGSGPSYAWTIDRCVKAIEALDVRHAMPPS